MRRSLPRERARRGLNDDRGTVIVLGELRRSLSGCVRRAREGARELGCGRKWAGGSGRAGREAQNGRGRAEVARECANVGERLGTG
jgi:hypothetical protein